MKKKFLFFTLFIIFLSIVMLNTFSTFTFAAYPALINKLNSAFEDIESWIIKIATPAAAVAVRYWSFYAKI